MSEDMNINNEEKIIASIYWQIIYECSKFLGPSMVKAFNHH